MMLFWQRWFLKAPVLERLCPVLGVKGSITRVNGGDIWYESFGDKKDPAFLLFMGAGCQGILWTDEYCKSLVSRGFYVIRFDYRDLGFSSYYNFSKKPYSFLDLAKDGVALLNALGIDKAHLMGISMGGAVAQLMASHFPEKVLSLTLIATSNEFGPVAAVMGGDKTKDYTLSYPREEWVTWMKELEGFSKLALASKLRKHLEGWAILNGTTIPFDEKYYKRLMTASLQRQRSFFSLFNHRLSLLISHEQLREAKGKITKPTLVVHGMKDPLFQKDHAEDLVSSIPGAIPMFFEEMGHNFNTCFHEAVLEETAKLARTSPI